VDVTFGTIEKRAQKARDNIAKMFGSSGNAGRGMQQIAGAADKAYAGVEKAAAKAARGQVKAQEQASREIERVLRQQVRAAEALDRQRSQGLMRQFREQEREARRSSRAMEQFAERTSHRTTRFLFPPPTGILSGARRVAGDIMRGAGVDMSIGGSVGRAVSLQSEAVGLANQERIATGKTRGAGFYEASARRIGDQFAKDPTEVLSLTRAFTGKTGNFDAAETMGTELTSIASASGANLTEMGDAAGYVFNQLKGLPDAGARTVAVMRGIVGQTAVGAVEMKDYATQLGRVAAGAQKFEGDVAQNILKFSAMTQLNIESGGATSAADAARGTAAFVNTLGKGARIKAFEKAGVNIFADEGKTVHRDPFEILKDSFRATKGNIPQLSNMYMDVLGRKTITGLTGAYKNAGGGEAGIAAVEKSLDRYMKAQLDAATEAKNNADIMASNAAKAKLFQNQLDQIVAATATDLVPALQKVAPVALAVADGFGSIIKFAAANPGMAITAAIVASIARAGLESAFRRAVENAMGGGSGSGPGGRKVLGGGTAGGALGAVGLGAAIGIPVAAAIYGEGISDWETTKDKTGKLSSSLAKSSGSQLQFDLIDAKNKMRELENDREGVSFGAWSGIKDGLGIGTEAEMNGLRDLIKRKEAELQAYQKTGQLPAGVKPEDGKAKGGGKVIDPNEIGAALANGLGTRTLNVRVMNLPAGGIEPPKVSPNGRAPAVGQ
jgi:hypothetical protein